MRFLRDPKGNVQGVIRGVGQGIERLYDPSGNTVATYRTNTDSTLDVHGNRIGTGNRLAGMVEKKAK